MTHDLIFLHYIYIMILYDIYSNFIQNTRTFGTMQGIPEMTERFAKHFDSKT